MLYAFTALLFIWSGITYMALEWYVALFVGVGVMGFETYAWMHLRARKITALVAQNDRASLLLNQNKISEAMDLLNNSSMHAREFPEIHVMLVYNLSVGMLRRGEVDRAISLAAAVYNSGWMQVKTSVYYPHYPSLLTHLARCLAAKGDLDKAEFWQGLAHEHAPPERRAQLVLSDVYIGVRRGRFAAVVRDATECWLDAEGTLSGLQLKQLRVLCAFALEQINADGQHRENIRELLSGSRPLQRECLDSLLVNWPELQQFVEKRLFTLPPLEFGPSQTLLPAGRE